MKLFEYPEEYWNSLGFEGSGEYEWKNKNGWMIEYMGTDDRPNCWRIDNFDKKGDNVLFLDIVTKKDIEWLLNAINVQRA